MSTVSQLVQGDLEDDANVPDRESSIKPRHHHSKTHSQQQHEEVYSVMAASVV